ncbi:MAG TPA: tRNA (adenosine(37)-N6)-threonylcarbamoyltransferase complex dimerization subunit type 1 TsaB [Bacteroidota bacterium]|nr:tRNA (adenosine(37)-N6)-threonylcarbamoyltransferase complex dimerization subunit type 1 TsaB [Bacteroidota bacterium]
MKVLAIETATVVCGAAVVENGCVLAERSVEAKQVHSQKIIELIDHCLSASDLEINDLDGIAVSIGPGSFTGLRIGVSTAKGLAYATGKHVVAVPTLEALAWNVVRNAKVERGELVLPMIDARRSEVYAAAYRYAENELVEVLASRDILVNELYALLDGHDRVVLAGDGMEKFRQHLATSDAAHARQVFVVPGEHFNCSPAAVGILGERRLECGQFADLASLEPLYVKEFHTTMVLQPPVQF